MFNEFRDFSAQEDGVKNTRIKEREVSWNKHALRTRLTTLATQSFELESLELSDRDGERYLLAYLSTNKDRQAGLRYFLVVHCFNSKAINFSARTECSAFSSQNVAKL